jgi:hypothetical protein
MTVVWMQMRNGYDSMYSMSLSRFFQLFAARLVSLKALLLDVGGEPGWYQPGSTGCFPVPFGAAPHGGGLS